MAVGYIFPRRIFRPKILTEWKTAFNVLIVITSLYLNKLELFCLHCSRKNIVSNQVRRI